MCHSTRGLPLRSTAVALGGCAVALLALGCGGAGEAGGSASTGTGPIPGSCQPFTATDAPGMYGWQDDGSTGYWFLKRDDANDRCMLLYALRNDAPTYGVKPSSGYGLSKVIITNSAADCEYNIDFSPVPKGETVEASCGGGTVSFDTSQGYLYYNYIKAHFEFPAAHPWVPANDTYCFSEYINAGDPFVSGC